MKKYWWLICIFVALLGISVIYGNKYHNVKQEYAIAVANNKAYNAQLDSIKNAFQFTVEQLEYIKDSTINELNEARRELGIKDNKIKQMSRVKEYVYITDTVKTVDTIFKDKDFVLDTCLGDQWYHNHLHLEYPGYLESLIEVNLEEDCYVYAERVTVNPPKKTWLGRLFQKKHDVLNVIVTEKNPYATIKESKFVKILD